MSLAEDEAWLRVRTAQGLCMEGLLHLHDPQGRLKLARARFREAHAYVAGFLTAWCDLLTTDQIAFLDSIVEEIGRLLDEARARLEATR